MNVFMSCASAVAGSSTSRKQHHNQAFIRSQLRATSCKSVGTTRYDMMLQIVDNRILMNLVIESGAERCLCRPLWPCDWCGQLPVVAPFWTTCWLHGWLNPQPRLLGCTRRRQYTQLHQVEIYNELMLLGLKRCHNLLHILLHKAFSQKGFWLSKTQRGLRGLHNSILREVSKSKSIKRHGQIVTRACVAAIVTSCDIYGIYCDILSCARCYRHRFDLLTDVGVAEQSGDLSIVEDSRGNIQASWSQSMVFWCFLMVESEFDHIWASVPRWTYVQ